MGMLATVINALALPFVLFSVLKLVNNPDVMGEHRNGVIYNIIAWTTTIVVTVGERIARSRVTVKQVTSTVRVVAA